jgi:16S rRNA (uracil1498-N3)-methyltransferase
MSRIRRFHVRDLGAEIVELSADEAHHLVHVLRLAEGAEIEIFDGNGRAASAEIVRISKGAVTVRLVAPAPSRESSLVLEVGIAAPKGDRMALVVQKLTELGAHGIVPLLTERGDVPERACRRNLERWRRVALEASKQCGRSRIPTVDEPRRLADVLGRGDALVLLAEPGAKPLSVSLPGDRTLLALIGPEGGWSEAELEIASARGVTTFGLGPRTLRTETAAIAAAVLLQRLAGDWRDEE